MKKVFVLFFTLFFAKGVFAFDIVYPKKTNVVINSPTTFFIGASNIPLTINNEQIELHKSGAFAHFVQLDYGENIFEINTIDKTEIYKITRPKYIPTKTLPATFVTFSGYKYFLVNEDNTPLRATPTNSGTNRITHLQKDVFLMSDGEYAGYYRVILNDNKKVWVDKNKVTDTEKFELSKTPEFERFETNDYFIFVFHLNKRVPYVVNEDKDLTLKFYNLENDYTFNFSKEKYLCGRNLLGYSAKYIGNDFVFKVRKYPVEINKKYPLKGITITVDAGHGGSEFGAIGCLGDKEKDINLKISKHLAHALKSKGANVIMTRDDDSNVKLYDRVEIANKNDSMFFISIHGNALPDTLNPNKHRGSSIFYYYEQAKPLSACILSSIIEKTGINNDNIHKESFAVIRNTEALSVLIEIAYLINPYDNELLTESCFQKNVAKAISEGIIKFLSIH